MQPKLVHKLSHRLALTPQLTQSLKVLAMNAMELDAHIEECLESNPLLERETDPDEAAPEVQSRDERENDWKEVGDNRWESMYGGGGWDQDNDRENQWEAEPDLCQELHDQVGRQPMSDVEHGIAHALIDTLDDDGYFAADIREVADSLEVNTQQIVDVLENVVQQLEPAGIAARSLTECLLLQLDEANATDKLVRRLLMHFSEHLFESDMTLAELAECSIEELGTARVRMRRLDPYPGHGMRGLANIYVRPEVIFRRLPEGGFQVEIPSFSYGVRFDIRWQNQSWKSGERNFMDNATREAKWLMQALEQRRDTLTKVATYLASSQGNFLEHGPMGLKPLTLMDVATAVNLHESTISRVTNGKYAQTPLGVIELKRFFSAGLPTRSGEAISVYRVQQRIKGLVESEMPTRPISDQAIADRLSAEGIEIARRTVAKYRENLGLPPSSERRKRPIKQRSSQRR
ncbi:MAG: RNA polymerase factor sigma-54 [Mariprofundaceae bacterium]